MNVINVDFAKRQRQDQECANKEHRTNLFLKQYVTMLSTAENIQGLMAELKDQPDHKAILLSVITNYADFARKSFENIKKFCERYTHVQTSFIQNLYYSYLVIVELVHSYSTLYDFNKCLELMDGLIQTGHHHIERFEDTLKMDFKKTT